MQQQFADGSPLARTASPWHTLGRWSRVAGLACLPFAAGLAAGVIGPSTLTSSLSPVTACAILLLGVPLWFLIAEALAAVLRPLIKARRPFVAVDAACGIGLLFVLFSLLITPWWGAAVSALVAAAVWWLVAMRTHEAFRAAVEHRPIRHRAA
ncbi:hypothetical protein [Galactobacter valiniphilus]|uniref:hypothetical protein n=1 Tax=Galactobacter valiniphilus TaxID=2676122 RepID=UPI0037369C95